MLPTTNAVITTASKCGTAIARDFGKPTSLWTLVLAAEVSMAEGLVSTRMSEETIRQTLLSLGIS